MGSGNIVLVGSRGKAPASPEYHVVLTRFFSFFVFYIFTFSTTFLTFLSSFEQIS